MNIFVLDEDPQIAASLHCDVHVVKMILETTQILCTVRHLSGNPVPEGYKPTHANHPCTKWAMESGGNYLWLWRLLHSLHGEYEYRYSKFHASKRLVVPLRPRQPPTGPRTPFIFCGPESCNRESVVESYRALYRLKAQTMKRPMRWTKTPAYGPACWDSVGAKAPKSLVGVGGGDQARKPTFQDRRVRLVARTKEETARIFLAALAFSRVRPYLCFQWSMKRPDTKSQRTTRWTSSSDRPTSTPTR